MKLSNDEMVEMILFPALNEACQLISKGIVTRPSDLDVASVLGMGFPAYRFAFPFLFVCFLLTNISY